MGQDLRSVVHYGVEVVRQVQSVPMFHLEVFCSSFKKKNKNNQEMFHDLVCISLLKKAWKLQVAFKSQKKLV